MNRYQRGIRTLNPDLVTRLREELVHDPHVSKAELARRLGVSRQTVVLYLKAMPRALDEAERHSTEIKTRRALTQLDLIDDIRDAVDDVRGVIGELRENPAQPGHASAVFRGYAVAERLWRLLGEMIGEVSPPTQNVYIDKVQALLTQPVDVAGLSPTARTAIGNGSDAERA